MNPAVPVIILDDDEDDDVQITEVRQVQHRKHQQEDGTKAVRDKENLGGCRQSLSLSSMSFLLFMPGICLEDTPEVPNQSSLK